MQLLRNRRFFPLFWTQFFGAFNDNFFKNALVILITFQTTQLMGIPSGYVVVLAGGIFILPYFLFSALAGQLADKYEKSQLIRWIKIFEIALATLAATGFLLQQYSFLLFVLFLLGFQSTAFSPLKYGILPQHLDEYEIVGGNALIEAGTYLAILLGTLGGGLLIGLEKTGTTWVSIGLILIAISGWFFSRYIPIAKPAAPQLVIKWNPITPTWEILKLIRTPLSVYRSILGISWFWFFGLAMLSLFPLYCKTYLKGDETLVTLFLTVFSVGVALGSLLCERLSRRHLELGLVPLGSIGLTLFTLDLYLIGTPSFALPLEEGALTVLFFFQQPEGVRIIVDLLLIAVFGGFFIVPLYTLIQIRAEEAQRSRVIAGCNILNALFMVVGSIYLAIVLSLKLTVPEIFLSIALMNAAIAIYIYTLMPEFLARFIIWCLANVMYRMKVVGGDNIPRDGSLVVVSNHVSYVDWLILAAAIKRPVRFVMHYAFTKGLMKYLTRQMKAIPIASGKENPEVLQQAFEKVAIDLQDRKVIGIFPEGALTWDGNMIPFRPGVERIVQRTPVPVVPVAICNMWGSYFSRKGGKAIKKRPRRFWTRIQVKIGQPIPAEKATAAHLQEQVAILLGEKV